MEIITGDWLPGATAGGSRNDLEKFATNPQYVLTLSQPGKYMQQYVFMLLQSGI